MRLTTKGRYAVTAMLDLAVHGAEKPVSLNDISGRQKISLSYLEQLFAKLRRQKLVRSVRGPGGGYFLGSEASNINVADIVDAVNETIDVTRCNRKGDCQEGDACLTHHLWCELSDQIHEFLSGITLQSLLDRQDVQDVAHRQQEKASQRIDLDSINDAEAESANESVI